MQENSEVSDFKKALAENHQKVKASANGQAEAEELPTGAAPIEAAAEESSSDSPAEEAPAPAPVEEEVEIQIGDKVFKSEKEAIKYAQKLEEESRIQEAYNQGIRETLESVKRPEPQQAPAEENFEEQFYSDPKGTLQKIQAKATEDALKIVDAREAEKAAWNKFMAKHPDLADSEAEVRRILNDNYSVLSKIKDEDKAMDILATKTRSYFQSIADRFKPRTELSNKGGQAVSPAGGAHTSVTPQKKESKPSDFATELKTMRRK